MPVGREVVAEAVHKVARVKLNVHEDVHAADARHVHGYQARVAVVNKEVGAQSARTEVVHAAGAECHVAQHNRIHICEPAVQAQAAAARRGAAQ